MDLEREFYKLVWFLERQLNNDLIEEAEELFEGDLNSEEAQNWMHLRGYKPIKIEQDFRETGYRALVLEEPNLIYEHFPPDCDKLFLFVGNKMYIQIDFETDKIGLYSIYSPPTVEREMTGDKALKEMHEYIKSYII